MKTMKTQLKTSITYYLQNNGYTLENYLKSQNSSMSDFNKQLETTAKTDVGKQLVYGAVAEKENITVSDGKLKKVENPKKKKLKHILQIIIVKTKRNLVRHSKIITE